MDESERADEILPADGNPTESQARRLAQLHEEFDFEMRPESVPELVERHDLQG